MNDEISDKQQLRICKICGLTLEWENCWYGCVDGYFDGYDDDPMWYDPGDLIMCGECHGKGGYLACPNAENHVKAERELKV